MTREREASVYFRKRPARNGDEIGRIYVDGIWMDVVKSKTRAAGKAERATRRKNLNKRNRLREK